MKTYRLYTGGDGQSHIEAIDLAKTPEWGKGLATTQISFREDPVGRFIDWHPAPRRQYVINLDATTHVTAGDGETRALEPGAVTLVEDTTGRGHITKCFGDATRRFIWLALD